MHRMNLGGCLWPCGSSTRIPCLYNMANGEFSSADSHAGRRGALLLDIRQVKRADAGQPANMQQFEATHLQVHNTVQDFIYSKLEEEAPKTKQLVF